MKVSRVLQMAKEFEERGLQPVEVRQKLDEEFFLDLEKGMRADVVAERRGQIAASILSIPFYVLSVVVYVPVRLIGAVGEAIARARSK